MRSHCPVIPAIRLLWMIITPLGRPVEPLVYMITARSEGSGLTISLPTAGQTNCCYFSIDVEDGEWKRGGATTRTVFRPHAQLQHRLHAVDGGSCGVAFCAHFLLVHVDHMLQFGTLVKYILDRHQRCRNSK